MTTSGKINDQFELAKSYFGQHKIPAVFEAIVAGLAFHQPSRPFDYIRDCMTEYERDAAGMSVTGSLTGSATLPWDFFIKRVKVAEADRQSQQAPSTQPMASKKTTGKTTKERSPSMTGGYSKIELPPIKNTATRPEAAANTTSTGQKGTGAVAAKAASVPNPAKNGMGVGVELPAFPQTLPRKVAQPARPPVAPGASGEEGDKVTLDLSILGSTVSGKQVLPGLTANANAEEASAAEVKESTGEVVEAKEEEMIEVNGFNGKKIIFVLGGPGSGKGTQCEKIVEDFKYTHLSAGDLLRLEVESGSPRGDEISGYMKEGKIVPMDVILALLKKAMEAAPEDSPGYLIDGFPRQMDQALEFEKTVGKCSLVLFYDCSEELLEKRLLKRGETSGRADDNIETIKKRFHTFVETSLPVIQHYQKEGKVAKISSEATIDEVYEQTKSYLSGEKKPSKFAHKRVIFVLGGPGSGKGTQCERIVNDYHYTHLSAGDLLRAEVQRGSPRGEEISNLMKEGKIVPMEVTISLLLQAMTEAPEDTPGFLIDGFPRQMDQALAFEKDVCECSFILFYECSEEVLEARLLKRGETSGRADDNIETIKKRFHTFLEASYPVVQHYENKAKVCRISSEMGVEEVYAVTKQYLDGEKVPTVPEESNTIVFILGGPGSGKGTQCAKIVEEFDCHHISSGDLLRNEVASGSELGLQLDELMKEGKMVPMDTTLKLLKKAMSEAGNKTILLDGFPRTMEQALEFENNVGKCNMAIYFDCAEETLVSRLMKRGETSGRADDNIDTIRKRITTFLEATVPVVQHYESDGRSHRIDSNSATPDEVFAQTRGHFENL